MGRARGSRSSNSRGGRGGRNQHATTPQQQQAAVQRIVDGIPHDNNPIQQELLNEEVQMEAVESDVSEYQEGETDQPTHPVEPRPPPGEPIPIFTQQCWKASWRRKFFTDWRWALNPENNNNNFVWARCNTGDCRRKTRYYKGGSTSFTNFEKHLKSAHKQLYEAFERQQASSSQDPKQPKLHQFAGQPMTLTKLRQKKLDTDLAFCLVIDNIPLNVLRRHRFRKWIHVRSFIHCLFS